MAITLKQRDGRRWSVNSLGIESLKRRYVVILDGNNIGADGEVASFTGLPAIGSAHPNHPNLFVTGYDFDEGEGGDKKTVQVTVNYGYQTLNIEGQGEEQVSTAVEEWGWDAGTSERELVTSATGVDVLNSAGDPFDRVPQVSTPAPVFTKVVKFAARQSNAMSFNCKVNDTQVTIGGMSCPQWCLLCNVSEKRIFGDPQFNYRYTIQLKYKTNHVRIAGSSSGIGSEIGWNVAVTDAGMRELSNGKMKLIRQTDPETGKRCTVTSSELLNGQGQAVDRSGGTPTPYNIFFQAYESASFPAWFYSEPSLQST